MGKSRPVVSIRLGEDTQREVESYKEANDMSNAEAYRDLVRRGLDADEIQDHLDRIDERLDRIEQKQNQSFFERLF